MAKRTLERVEKLSDKEVHNRLELIANIHSCLGNAYLETANYDKALEHHTIDYDIANEK